MITIKNENYIVTINENGATLDSIKYKGKEYLWQGDKLSWEGKDVAIFPFVARLKDGYYTHEDKVYELKTHGIIRYSTLNVESISENKAVLSLAYSEKTLKCYPYKFKFSATFSLEKDMLEVEYMVENLDNKPIFFGLGGHPAFNIPFSRTEEGDDISQNKLVFNKTYDIDTYTLDEKGCFITGKDHFATTNTIELSKELFKEYKTLMLKSEGLNELVLQTKDQEKIEFKYSGADILAIWSSEVYGGYVCLEPWTSTPDNLSPQREIENKDTLVKLSQNNSYKLNYSIKIL